MRILLVNTGFLPVPPDKGGSIESHTYHLAKELAKLGNEIDYVTSVNPTTSFDERIKIYKLPWIPFDFHGGYLKTTLSFIVGGFSAFLKAVKAISDSQHDIIHVHGHVSGFCLLPLRKKAAFVFTVHNPNPWMVNSFSHVKQAYRICAFKSIELKIVKSADFVIAVSEILKDEFVHRFQIPLRKIRVIPNGVDTNFFRPNIKQSGEVLLKYKLPEDYILFVGRLVEQKGLQFLLKAIKGTQINLVVVGGGPLFPYFKKLCQRLEIVKQVHFIHRVPLHDLRRIYSLARLFVIPSVAEGFPGLVSLEAMASGLPVVASKIKGIENVVVNGHNGFLFDVGNIKQLRTHIIHLFEDKELAKTMGKRSRQIAETRYSWKQIAKKTHELYAEIIQNRLLPQ